MTAYRIWPLRSPNPTLREPWGAMSVGWARTNQKMSGTENDGDLRTYTFRKGRSVRFRLDLGAGGVEYSVADPPMRRNKGSTLDQSAPL